MSPNPSSLQNKQNNWDTASLDKVFNLYVTRFRGRLSLILRHTKIENND
jgi:hypothetical protein